MCGYSWNIQPNLVLPEIDYGKFRIAMSMNAGPLGHKVAGAKDVIVRK
jgi:hypothetical protein